MSEHILDANGLHSFYGVSHILHGVDFTVKKGATIGLMGRNGMGKTTLCNAITGLVPATGSIKLFGEEILGLPTHQITRRGIAYVPLRQQGEVWVGGEVVRTAPADGLYLTCDDSSWRLRCGIESWFLPQADAKAFEDAVRAGRAVATVRVDGSGHAALVDVETR